MTDGETGMLRHFLAALAYRTQKALREAPSDFGDFAAGNLTRTPRDLVQHMTSVLGYARTFFRGGTYRPGAANASSVSVWNMTCCSNGFWT